MSIHIDLKAGSTLRFKIKTYVQVTRTELVANSKDGNDKHVQAFIIPTNYESNVQTILGSLQAGDKYTVQVATFVNTADTMAGPWHWVNTHDIFQGRITD